MLCVKFNKYLSFVRLYYEYDRLAGSYSRRDSPPGKLVPAPKLPLCVFDSPSDRWQAPDAMAEYTNRVHCVRSAVCLEGSCDERNRRLVVVDLLYEK